MVETEFAITRRDAMAGAVVLALTLLGSHLFPWGFAQNPDEPTPTSIAADAVGGEGE